MVADRKRNSIDYENWSKTELIREITKLNKRKKYGLVWDEEKTKEVFEEEVQKKLPVLRDITKNGIEDKSKPNNILIEGDNYHALSVLNYTHKNKIDAIYIDPPYNTGNGNAFRYNDKIINDDDAYKHSKWLSFMKKRLGLAKKLLTKKGIIFISIDDHEGAQLKLLCDEIFGEKNFIANIVWQRKYVSANDVKGISTTHEYLTTYAKNHECWEPGLFRRTQAQLKAFTNPDNDPRGIWRASDLSARTYSPKTDYLIAGPTGKEFRPPPSRSWVVNKKRFEALLKDNRITFGRNQTGRPMLKKFLTEVRDGITPDTWWSREKAGDNKEARYEIKELFPQNIFSTPKPTKLIEMCIKIAIPGKKGIVLDFFAGSGTTGQAILKLNKEDGGSRKFILCTNNENKICTDVCYPRLKKVIKGYKNSKGEKIEGLEGNLKYFRTSFVDSEPTDYNKKIIVEQSTEMLCLKEDCFELVKNGKQFKIFRNHADHHLGIVYYYDGIEPFVKEVLKIGKKIHTYVFSLADQVDNQDFRMVDQLVTLKPMPSAILNVYRRIFVYAQTA